MAILTITATDVGPELVVGIPQLVELSTNIPAVMYYTLDGSTPTLISPVYLHTIQLPTKSKIRLRVLAISGSDTGTLDITFLSVQEGLESAPQRHSPGGVVVDAYGVPFAVVDGYGPDIDHPVSDNEYPVDVVVRGADEPLTDYDIKFSRTGFDGEGDGTLISIGFATDEMVKREETVDPSCSSPNDNNIWFNPRAQFILIDGRDGPADQSVYIINRPWGGTMDDSRYLGGKSLYEPAPYISGGIVRQFYNYEKGIGIFYYFDHNECRWIKSIQKMEEKLPSGIAQRNGNIPLVFAWIHGKRSMI